MNFQDIELDDEPKVRHVKVPQPREETADKYENKLAKERLKL
jgi:hypothetical protein